MSIPANQFVSVTPSVLSAGGSPLALNGLVLSEAEVLPLGEPISFPSVAAVEAYFDVNSTEAAMASVYFNGFLNSTAKPSAILFSRYPKTAISAFERGGAMGLTLAQVKAIPSTQSMTVVVDGSLATCPGVDLSSATSISEAASLIEAAFTGASAPDVTYSSLFDAITLTSPTDGASSTIEFAAGTLATTLKLTSATGAVLSQGAAATTPAAHMANLVKTSQNWASFATTFEPLIADKEAFAAWTSTTGGRYLFSCWDTDVNAYATPGIANTSFGQYLNANETEGVAPIFVTDAAVGPLHAAFLLGAVAAIDFTRTEGRITLDFKRNSGLSATVTDETKAANLTANGYNYYAAVATANDQFTFFTPGQVSGSFAWIDSYVNAIWLTNQLQLALMTLFLNTNSIPYNQDGRAMITEAALDPIRAAVNAGVIRKGVSLSAQQTAEVNTAAGADIASTLSSRGWYFQVQDATAQVRALRQSPPCTLWYMDGQSVQKLNVASIDIQ